MAILKFALYIFFLPGDYLSKKMGATLEKDGGVLRSFINMIFWGSIFLILVSPLFAR